MKTGDPGYLERVDFNEVIGLFLDPVTYDKIPTRWGIIVHGKDGVFIVLARSPSNEIISEDVLKQRVLAELKRALPTSLPAHFNGVSVGWPRSEIGLFCYFDGEISESDREVMNDIAGEMSAGFVDHNIDVKYFKGEMPKSQRHFNLNAFINK
tara:strand:- start:87 stop:545 length:459 start_codon:yes stop_codon:yes gene_type:complete